MITVSYYHERKKILGIDSILAIVIQLMTIVYSCIESFQTLHRVTLELLCNTLSSNSQSQKILLDSITIILNILIFYSNGCNVYSYTIVIENADYYYYNIATCKHDLSCKQVT